jgi:hypothetical protein
MKDLKNSIAARSVISPQVIADNTALVGEVIDRQGYESVTYLIQMGDSVTNTDATFTVLLEESDDENFATSNAVADEDLIGTEADASFDGADDNTVTRLGYIGNKRYTRLTLTPADNASGDAQFAAICVLGHAHSRPVS